MLKEIHLADSVRTLRQLLRRFRRCLGSLGKAPPKLQEKT
jgi:hypothetical protein